MMQMISALGVPAFADDARPADASNPRGYLEHAAVRRLDRDQRFLEQARGHVVKIVSPLLTALPGPTPPFRYRVVFMRRELEEVLRSQATMLDVSGASSPDVPEAKLRVALEKAEVRAREFASTRSDVEWIEVDYAALRIAPLAAARRVAAFVCGAPDEAAAARMAACVDPMLYRSRGVASASRDHGTC
jgi:hypothetical protein